MKIVFIFAVGNSFKKENMIEENVKITSKFLRTVYGDDIIAIAQILNAEAENDKQTLKNYLECVKVFCDKLYDSLA